VDLAAGEEGKKGKKPHGLKPEVAGWQGFLEAKQPKKTLAKEMTELR